ncbi:hypothetical protein ZOSMA_115G00130 [Zostera marina]|uniref:Uncharacterized protein n=1 Tax=Zostera marina TaxID=29655 RepID=A0A0K9Q4C5_ZOSMR|nr:hypothetical protein ZOSMA_115G00130 [Zostera marina]
MGKSGSSVPQLHKSPFEFSFPLSPFVSFHPICSDPFASDGHFDERQVDEYGRLLVQNNASLSRSRRTRVRAHFWWKEWWFRPDLGDWEVNSRIDVQSFFGNGIRRVIQFSWVRPRKLSSDLFLERQMSAMAVSTNAGLMNLVGCWFGAMPVCHGAGGLA